MQPWGIVCFGVGVSEEVAFGDLYALLLMGDLRSFKVSKVSRRVGGHGCLSIGGSGGGGGLMLPGRGGCVRWGGRGGRWGRRPQGVADLFPRPRRPVLGTRALNEAGRTA